MILVEADVSEEWDSSTGWVELAGAAVRAAVAETAAAALLERGPVAEVSVRFAGDEMVRKLNAQWRGKDKPTNVLSFPMVEAEGLGSLPEAEGELLLGDIALAAGVCAREARDKGIDPCSHAAHLIVHGTLHLLGHDHEEGEAEAEAMEAVEQRALARLGIADPYRAYADD
jgi:probable rRNA maturation factor